MNAKPHTKPTDLGSEFTLSCSCPHRPSTFVVVSH